MVINQMFMWVAFLKDGSTITEFNPDGSENLYKELPREKMTHFGLIRGQRSSYFIDLKNGVFHIKDHRMDKATNIVLPVGRKGIPICGKNMIYAFHHFKEAHQDFNAVGQNMGGTVIDKFLLGWSNYQQLPEVGSRFVETTLYLDNVEAPKPVLKVFLRAEPGGKPINGSPYEISL